MICPKCGHEDFMVIDTRPVENLIRRRRECKCCGKRITTYEAEVHEQIRPTSDYLKRATRRAIKIFIDEAIENGGLK